MNLQNYKNQTLLFYQLHLILFCVEINSRQTIIARFAEGYTFPDSSASFSFRVQAFP